MSFARADARPEAGQPAAGPARLLQELKVSAHLMSLPNGLFCILHEAASGARGQAGLPAIRISPPPNGAGGVEISGFRPDGWLGAGGDAALVKIAEGPAQILVTIYQAANAPEPPPKLQVRQLAGPENPATPAGLALPPGKPDFMAHLQGAGDTGARFGDWLGEKGGGNWIEGFALAPLQGFPPAELSYQAVLGRGWLSPWVEAGQYCGSRGMALPLLGLRLRLQGETAEAFQIGCTASFVDGSESSAGSDETCASEKLAPLEAMCITLTPRPRKARKK